MTLGSILEEVVHRELFRRFYPYQALYPIRHNPSSEETKDKQSRNITLANSNNQYYDNVKKLTKRVVRLPSQKLVMIN
jgi:hypothetical protein